MVLLNEHMVHRVSRQNQKDALNRNVLVYFSTLNISRIVITMQVAVAS